MTLTVKQNSIALTLLLGMSFNAIADSKPIPNQEPNAYPVSMEGEEVEPISMEELERQALEMIIDCKFDLICMHENAKSYVENTYGQPQQYWMELEKSLAPLQNGFKSACDIPTVETSLNTITECFKASLEKHDAVNSSFFEDVDQCVIPKLKEQAKSEKNVFAFYLMATPLETPNPEEYMREHGENWFKEFKAEMTRLTFEEPIDETILHDQFGDGHLFQDFANSETYIKGKACAKTFIQFQGL